MYMYVHVLVNVHVEIVAFGLCLYGARVLTRYSFLINSPHVWNSLPPHVVHSQSFSSFKYINFILPSISFLLSPLCLWYILVCFFFCIGEH